MTVEFHALSQLHGSDYTPWAMSQPARITARPFQFGDLPQICIDARLAFYSI
jgi:hypothetical protein